MAKYVIMLETDKFPDPGNCESCELHCSYYMSWFDKQMIMEHNNIRCVHHLNDFYCPIRAVVDVETYMKWKEEHPDLGEPKRLEDNNGHSN